MLPRAGLLPLQLVQLPAGGVLFIPQQQDHHRSHGQKQHTALSQGVKAPVADDHGRHDVL